MSGCANCRDCACCGATHHDLIDQAFARGYEAAERNLLEREGVDLGLPGFLLEHLCRIARGNQASSVPLEYLLRLRPEVESFAAELRRRGAR